MRKTLAILIIIFISFQFSSAQNFGDFPTIKKEKLLNDLDILYQGLDKFHSGMYWYTPKDSVDLAFDEVRQQISDDLNVFEFHKLIAPLVALSREGHTGISPPSSVIQKMFAEAKFIPLNVVCVANDSDLQHLALEGKRVESINGETPISIVNKIGNLFAADGYIKPVKYSDLEGLQFSLSYFYYYGQASQFEIKFEEMEESLTINALTIKQIRKNNRDRVKKPRISNNKDLLEYKILRDSIAYLGIHSFSDTDIKEESNKRSLKSFLESSFKSIKESKLKTIIIDVGKNSGGTEGNEGLLYSYFGEDYQKYKKVVAKTQKAILDNGTDQPITLKTFGLLERIFTYKKMKDGSLERKQWIGPGLRAYKKEPKYKFAGKIYVIISPVTYSGASEFSNMMYTKDLATFVGQETGGGYYGNTSGYSKKLVLPNSKIKISIPTLQFVMNVEPKLPFGRGVIPQHQVIPTFEQYVNGENAAVKYILTELEGEE